MKKVKCIFMPQYELDEILEDIYETVIEVEAEDEEGWLFYNANEDDYLGAREVFVELAKHLGVAHITSMHINACYSYDGDNEIWICYKDKEDLT